MTACPTPEQLTRMVEMALSGPEQAAVEEHVDRCPHCQQILEQLTAAAPAGELVVDLEAETFVARVRAVAAAESARHLPLPVGPKIGGRLGRFRVLAAIGQGGMGAVYRAEDTVLHRLVALKVMLPEYATDPDARNRFLREARSQATVEHDHVTPIFDVGEDGGTPFLAMPLLRGSTLSTALREDPRPPLTTVVRVGRQIAEGLAAAHDRGLIHRDIKPGNIWLEQVGGADRGRPADEPAAAGSGLNPASPAPRSGGARVKILDFGLARAADMGGRRGSGPVGFPNRNRLTFGRPEVPPTASDPAPTATHLLTATGTLVGTPQYMSPEQIRGGTVDARTDLFSLGVTLFQMVTGQLPFTGPTVDEILRAVSSDLPPPLPPLPPTSLSRSTP